MKDLFKKFEAAFTIAEEIKPCVAAFKTKNYKKNPTEAINLSVAISKKLETEYGLKGNAIEYIKSLVQDAIKTFDSVSADIKNHEYFKAVSDFADSGKKLITEQESLVSAIIQDVDDAKSSTAIKQFKTDKVDAGIDLFENIISFQLFVLKLRLQQTHHLKTNYKQFYST